MKTRLATLLAFGCLGTLSLLSVSHAQQPADHSVYVLNYAIVADTKQPEHVWYINVKGASTNAMATGAVYKSLSSPTLHQWISQLPRDTEIEYHPSSLPLIGKAFRNPETELPAFEQFCKDKGVNFNDRFPVL